VAAVDEWQRAVWRAKGQQRLNSSPVVTWAGVYSHVTRPGLCWCMPLHTCNASCAPGIRQTLGHRPELQVCLPACLPRGAAAHQLLALQG